MYTMVNYDLNCELDYREVDVFVDLIGNVFFPALDKSYIGMYYFSFDCMTLFPVCRFSEDEEFALSKESLDAAASATASITVNSQVSGVPCEACNGIAAYGSVIIASICSGIGNIYFVMDLESQFRADAAAGDNSKISEASAILAGLIMVVEKLFTLDAAICEAAAIALNRSVLKPDDPRFLTVEKLINDLFIDKKKEKIREWYKWANAPAKIPLL